MARVVAIYSGGMDSTVLLWKLRAEGHEVKALSFDYGQRHRKELGHAAAICANAGIAHDIVDLSPVQRFIAKGSQTGAEPVPEGHYAEETMKATIVPNRNMIMLSVAVGHALALGYDAVAYAAHAGDHAIYPDCRPGFVLAMGAAIAQADWRQVQLLAPFIAFSKANICQLGAKLFVPLWRTWSCYKGGEMHCGKCGTCVERREAFQLAGVPDPTGYTAA